MVFNAERNIAIHYTDKVFYAITEIECIAPMPVSRDSLTGSTTVTDPVEVSPVPVEITRRSLWKRAKKFARWVFCCGAAWYYNMVCGSLENTLYSLYSVQTYNSLHKKCFIRLVQLYLYFRKSIDLSNCVNYNLLIIICYETIGAHRIFSRRGKC